MKRKQEQVEELKLGDAVSAVLNECRMILPGVQALFGFQLVAVYNDPFFSKLTLGEQQLHLVALGLIALAGALIMAPAAYHRQTAPHHASDGFIRLAGYLLLLAMIPLALGIGIDFYVIARVILQNRPLSLLLSVVLVAVFAVAWFGLPRMRLLRTMTGTDE